MQIDEIGQTKNAEFPMHASLEPDSKVTRERTGQPHKHWSNNSSTDEGMQIDERCEQP
jgi:hypothetical protein